MAQDSRYIGPRLRRIRRDLGLTQANMAADLEISASYVALLERNQRPLTADLLIRLARTYDLDIARLAGDGGAEQQSRLTAVLRDPIFADIDLPAMEAADVAANYPGFAEALLRLHTAWREEQLALEQQRMREAALRAAEEEGIDVELSLEEKARMELQQNAINLAKERPDDVAQLLRTWLAEE